MNNEMEPGFINGCIGIMWGVYRYYGMWRGLNHGQYHFKVYWRYPILLLMDEIFHHLKSLMS